MAGKQEVVRCIITITEALVIKKLREIEYGQVVIHKQGGKVFRVENQVSDLVTDKMAEDAAIELIKASGIE